MRVSMSAIQNMPLFHKITATEHAVLDSGDQWSREAGELAVKLRAWLNGSRCVLIFTTDDSFHHDLYSDKTACSFFVREHEVLVLEPAEITLELLSVAYHSEPQYYLRTNVLVDAVQPLLEDCLKDEGEEIWRNGDFDELALHREFGDFIMVCDGWSEHRMAGEKDVIAHDEEIKALRAAERTKPVWRKVLRGVRVALFILGCLAFVVPMLCLICRIARPLWKCNK